MTVRRELQSIVMHLGVGDDDVGRLGSQITPRAADFKFEGHIQLSKRFCDSYSNVALLAFLIVYVTENAELGVILP